MTDQSSPPSSDTAAPPGAMRQETFRIRTHLRVKSIIDAIWPAFMLVMIAVMYFWLIVPSHGSYVEFDFKYKPLIPPLVVVLLIWLVWDIRKVVKAFQFAVTVSEEGIVVNGVSQAWAKMVRAEVKPAMWWNPAIILHRPSGDTLEIPGGLEGVEYLGGIVTRKVNQAAQDPAER